MIRKILQIRQIRNQFYVGVGGDDINGFYGGNVANVRNDIWQIWQQFRQWQ